MVLESQSIEEEAKQISQSSASSDEGQMQRQQQVHDECSFPKQIQRQNIEPIEIDLNDLLKNPEQFVKVFGGFYSRGNILAKKEKVKSAIQEYGNCVQMLEIGAEIFSRLQNQYWPICIYANLACLYQMDWKIEKSSQCLSKAQNILKQMIHQVIENRKIYELFPSTDSTDREKQSSHESIQMQIQMQREHEKYLHLSTHLIRMNYRQCAILSQLDQNQKAIETCEETLPLIKENIELIKEHARKFFLHAKTKSSYGDEEYHHHKEKDGKKSTFNQKQRHYGVKFGPRVYGYAFETFDRLLSKLQVSCKAHIPSTVSKSQNLNFYYWQKNPERNEQQLRNSFIPNNFDIDSRGQIKKQSTDSLDSGSSFKRSVLGIKKQKIWLDEFNIGLLMKMTLCPIGDWEKIIPIEEYFFKENVEKYVIYTSVGYFTMATEIRFIDNALKLKAIEGNNSRGVSEQEGKQDGSRFEGQKKSQVQNSNQKSEQDQKLSHTPIPSYINRNIMKSTTNPKLCQIKKRYGYEQKSQGFTLSESHHLTAISIVTENIQCLIPYLSHLIKSYDKHYIFKKNLDEIAAIPEESILEQSKMAGSHIQVISRTVSRQSGHPGHTGDGFANGKSLCSGSVKMGNYERQMRVDMMMEESSEKDKSEKNSKQIKDKTSNPNQNHRHGKFVHKKPQQLSRQQGYGLDGMMINQATRKHYEHFNDPQLAAAIDLDKYQQQRQNGLFGGGTERRPYKSQRKTYRKKNSKSIGVINNTYNHGIMDQDSDRQYINKSAGKKEILRMSKSMNKLSQTLKPPKRKMLTQESLEDVEIKQKEKLMGLVKDWKSNKGGTENPKKKIIKGNFNKKSSGKISSSTQHLSGNRKFPNQFTSHKNQEENEKSGNQKTYRTEKTSTTTHGVSGKASNKESTKRSNKAQGQKFKDKIHDALGMGMQGGGELHVKHKSCTSFKLVFKKKK